MELSINDYQRKCGDEYKSTIGLDNSYSYLYGDTVKVHIPVEVGLNNLMIVSAYPTAQFNFNGSFRDSKNKDHLYPFSNDTFLDGDYPLSNSGKELDELFLKPLGIKREDCWITDLIKVFLFKDAHIKKYKQLDRSGVITTRDNFDEYAKKSMQFLIQELKICNPKIILLLGEEVTSVIYNISKQEAYKALLSPELVQKEVEGKCFKFIAAPHPGIIMHDPEVNGRWLTILKESTIPLILQNIK